MNAIAEHDRPAPLLRQWWTWVAIILAGQAGFIFWLGANRPPAPRAPNFTPPIFFAADQPLPLAEFLDPTIFALPNAHGFSGAARTFAPRLQFTAPDWDEPFRWLPLPAQQLGDAVRQLVRDHQRGGFSVAEKTAPEAATAGVEFPLPLNSTVTAEGARELAAIGKLPSWPAADVLAATEVRAVVSANGRVVSATLLASSGLAEADQRALAAAREARFTQQAGDAQEQFAHPLNALAVVKLVFKWHTVALPPAETPVANP